MSTKQQPLVNRVAQSGLITLKLEDDYPREEFYAFDLKDYLFKGLILKEKDFREALKQHNWTQYQDGILLVYCLRVQISLVLNRDVLFNSINRVPGIINHDS